MARNDKPVEPGDDSAIADHIERVRSDRSFQAAPQPEPGEQPDPPAGTVPVDDKEDERAAKAVFVATRDVGIFQAGATVKQDHWRPSRLRSLEAQGFIRRTGAEHPPKEERKDK